MKRRTKIAVAAATLVGAAAAGTGVAVAGGSGDDDGTDTPITGAELDRASAVALQETGGGRVTETEKGDEEGYYEVEVTLDDGHQVDVHLDRDFHVINSKADDDSREGQDSGDS
jgi:uncharacterized membrane protein YkoI